MALLEMTPAGLRCPAGDFYIDPHRPVDRAVITHAHSDHARTGSRNYLCTADGEALLRARVGRRPIIEALPYGTSVVIGGVRVSLHPAGHVLGSAQVRVEHRGEVWVVSGDYKLQRDPTCTPFEPVRCEVFITESTFGLPIYRWPDPQVVFEELNAWWRTNAARGVTSIVQGYSLGKAQRLLAGLDPAIGPILVHEAVDELLPAFRDRGIVLPSTRCATPDTVHEARGSAIVVVPPGAGGPTESGWGGPTETALASGWMRVRGGWRSQRARRGFVLSDHVDWPALVEAVRATAARRVLVTHGYTKPVVRWLRENGWEADELEAPRPVPVVAPDGTPIDPALIPVEREDLRFGE